MVNLMGFLLPDISKKLFPVEVIIVEVIIKDVS